MEKKYQVVCYLRIDPPDNGIPLNYKEALQDKEQFELMHPENIYRIEEIADD